jgi:hypothetical protein
MFADSLNIAKWSARSVDVSFVGRTTSFHEGVGGPRVAVLKADPSEALKSETPIRIASRNPSRPTVELPVAKGWLELLNVMVEKGGTGSILPLLVTVEAAPKPMVALPPVPVPLMVIRTGGRK